jgi:hypothetical protein
MSANPEIVFPEGGFITDTAGRTESVSVEQWREHNYEWRDDHMAKLGWRAAERRDRHVLHLRMQRLRIAGNWGADPHAAIDQWEAEKRQQAADEAEETESARRFVTSAEFLAETDDPTPSYLGDGVIAKGSLCVGAGETGIGKTTWETNCAIHLSAGVAFHGLAVPRKVRTLVLELEAHRTYFRQRYRSICSTLGITGEVLFRAPGQDAPAIGDWNGLRSLVEETETEVCFLDTIGFFCDLEENSASDWKRKVAKPLRAISRALPWEPAFFAMTHYGKPSELRSGLHRVRGSSAIIGDCDTGILFERRGDRIVLRFAKIRNGPPLPDRLLKLDGPTGVVRWIEDTAPEMTAAPPSSAPEPPDDKARIVEAVRANPGSSQTKIRDLLKISPNRLGPLLRELETAGKLRDDGEGPFTGQRWSVIEPEAE